MMLVHFLMVTVQRMRAATAAGSQIANEAGAEDVLEEVISARTEIAG